MDRVGVVGDKDGALSLLLYPTKQAQGGEGAAGSSSQANLAALAPETSAKLRLNILKLHQVHYVPAYSNSPISTRSPFLWNIAYLYATL